MPVRFSRATRLILSVSFWTSRKRGRQVDMMASTITHSATTKPAVTAESSQLLPRILITAQTAMIGALMSICRPMATIIWICVMSLVVRVMRLGTEKSCISSLPTSITWWNSCSRTVKLKPDAVLAARKPQPTASTALASVQPSICAPTLRMSAVALPGVLIRVVSWVMKSGSRRSK